VSRSLGATVNYLRRLAAMKRYHGHPVLYLHETIELGSGRSDRFSGDERSREEQFT